MMMFYDIYTHIYVMTDIIMYTHFLYTFTVPKPRRKAYSAAFRRTELAIESRASSQLHKNLFLFSANIIRSVSPLLPPSLRPFVLLVTSYACNTAA